MLKVLIGRGRKRGYRMERVCDDGVREDAKIVYLPLRE